MIVIKWVDSKGLRSISGYLPDSSQKILQYNPRHVPVTETVSALARTCDRVPFWVKAWVLRTL